MVSTQQFSHSEAINGALPNKHTFAFQTHHSDPGYLYPREFLT
jgi:hypothetical protein